MKKYIIILHHEGSRLRYLCSPHSSSSPPNCYTYDIKRATRRQHFKTALTIAATLGGCVETIEED